ncbi:MAG: UvrD-helicase domain-containing protein [Spirochaetaceae bacterium]|jgi:DNA helicase-2/ATP-dependent DNA helicase PcrA|nr:UvrD-helicase domain-containing protein [Spirochaetaceae bacterium]
MRLNIDGDLNPMQAKAVTCVDGPVLIIAGAGSGKTRVITYRIAHMLERGIPQSQILALTFTNKAAREMEVRVKELTGRKLPMLTVSTFHSFGAQILRNEIETLGYRKNFSIYDEGDKTQAVSEALRECKLSGDGNNPRDIASLFSNVKTGMAQWGVNANTAYRDAYDEYQRNLKVYNACDFDDLLVLPVMLFEEHPDVLQKYRGRYKYIMVDEFQDTSGGQYRMMKLLADRNVCVVGDDDQSIYSWRGANYENIVNFEKDFPGLLEIKLEQNYRSTTTILEAANGVIAHNNNRKEKKLWADNAGGKPIAFHIPDNESAEADFIVEQILAIAVHDKLKYDDFGILLRANSLTTSIEEALLAANIPYHVSGGQSFFARKEIKDIISYLRVVANPNDDVNLLRIVNTPRRGIGKTAIAGLMEVAKKNGCPFWDAMTRVRYAEQTFFQEVAKVEIDEFMSLIERQREALLGKRGLSAKVRALVDEIDYHGYLLTEYNKSEKLARFKCAMIETFLQSIETWEGNDDNLDPTLYPYLNRISLITRDEGAGEADKGKVNVMTIHASKGLEFPVVFIAGAEEGIIPHERSLEEESGNIEEERRLFYVAITRARDKLFITSCAKRKRNQALMDRLPSPFLSEIPPHLMETFNPEKSGTLTSTTDFFTMMKAKFAAV